MLKYPIEDIISDEVWHNLYPIVQYFTNISSTVSRPKNAVNSSKLVLAAIARALLFLIVQSGVVRKCKLVWVRDTKRLLIIHPSIGQGSIA